MSVSLKAGGGAIASKKVKVERPRPLKIGGGTQPELGVEDLLVVVENVRRSLSVTGVAENNFDLLHQLQILSANLKISGSALEKSHKDLMDKLNHALVSACRQDQFSLVSRLHMLELLELRTMKWQSNENVANYYKQKLAQIESDNKIGQSQSAPALHSTLSTLLNPAAPDFNPFQASFQEKETNDLHELQPVDTQVKKNRNDVTTSAPPPAQVQEQEKKNFSVCVKIRNEELIVSGASIDLVKTARIVLNEFFNICPPTVEAEADEPNSSESTVLFVKPDIIYNKQELIEMSKSPLCRKTPKTWEGILKELPEVARRPERVGPTSKLILREMEGLRKQEEAKHV